MKIMVFGLTLLISIPSLSEESLHKFLANNVDVQQAIVQMENKTGYECTYFAHFIPLPHTITIIRNAMTLWRQNQDYYISGQSECVPGTGEKGLSVLLGVIEKEDSISYKLIGVGEY